MNDRSGWYVAEAGRVHGPLSEEEVAALIQAARISRGSLLYSSEIAEWVPVESVRNFRDVLPPAPRGRVMYRGIAGVLTLIAVLVLPRVATKLPTIQQALGSSYWNQMTLSEYLLVAIPIGFCSALLLLALVMAARRG